MPIKAKYIKDLVYLEPDEAIYRIKRLHALKNNCSDFRCNRCHREVNIGFMVMIREKGSINKKLRQIVYCSDCTYTEPKKNKKLDEWFSDGVPITDQ